MAKSWLNFIAQFAERCGRQKMGACSPRIWFSNSALIDPSSML
jgi:hypothetical protein